MFCACGVVYIVMMMMSIEMINLPVPTISTHSSKLPEGLSGLTQRYNRGYYTSSNVVLLKVIHDHGRLVSKTKKIDLRPVAAEPKKSKSK